MEYARSVMGFVDAHSTEFIEDTKNPVVIFMPEIDKDNLGGTMRLGARDTIISDHPTGDKSICYYLYGEKDVISERHRHRYEVNPEKVDSIASAGLSFVGRDDTGERMEVRCYESATHNAASLNPLLRLS